MRSSIAPPAQNSMNICKGEAERKVEEVEREGEEEEEVEEEEEEEED